MNNYSWYDENDELKECSYCKNFMEGEYLMSTCLACKHMYTPYTDPYDHKPDLFEDMRGKEE